jgi:cytochrome c oxidase subunit II
MIHQGMRLVMAALLSLAPGCSGPQSALDPAGAQADRISALWWLYFWVCTAVYGLVVLFLIFAALRRRPPDLRTQPIIALNIPRDRRFTGVVTWAIVGTIVILFVFLIADFHTGRGLASLGAKEGTNALTIRITGHQWWWEVEYSDPAPSNIVKTANEFHIPLGRPVKFELKSTDVIHSFWVPNLHGKKDLIPGYQTTTCLQADRAGTYFGQCAEFCGHQHARMRFLLVAEPEDKFKSWLNAQRQTPPPPATDAGRRGRQLFLGGTCLMCHTVDGTGARATVGPNLTHLASRRMIGAASRVNTRENLARWIVDPQHIKPGVRMPMHHLTSAQVEALLDYLQTLQ